MTRVAIASFQRVRATNSPSARQRNGYAGRMYVGSLLPEQLKKNTHHAPAMSQKPPAGESTPPTHSVSGEPATSVAGRDSNPATDVAGSPRRSRHKHAAISTDPGNSPATRIGT